MTTNEMATTDDVPRQDRLAQIRKELIETGYYLGDPTNRVHQNVVWKRVGRSHQLFIKPPAPAGEGAGTLPSPPSSQEFPALEDDERAVLYAVVCISYGNCFLAACGNWEGPSKYAKSFADVKLSFRGCAPTTRTGLGGFEGDFEVAVESGRALMSGIAVEDTRDVGFVMPAEGSLSPFESLRFRHVLFDVNFCLF